MIARLIEDVDIADEVRHFVFEADCEELDYLPGQFVSFNELIDGKKVTRAYSIASSPHGNIFELCLNRVAEGKLSPRLFEMQVGDCIEMQGPLGYFVLRNPVSDSIFVATGTGIAPFRAMIKGHIPQDRDHSFTLLFGIRFEHNIMYREEFEKLAAHHPNFHFCPTLTQPGPGWKGLTGRVQAHLPELIGERRDIDVYICGMKAMVDDVRQQLKAMGFERKRIIYEKYD
jgi:CDP-4-dehydro-6-deoxyglucose reductase